MNGGLMNFQLSTFVYNNNNNDILIPYTSHFFPKSSLPPNHATSLPYTLKFSTSLYYYPKLSTTLFTFLHGGESASELSNTQVLENEADVKVCDGFTMTQLCDKMIDLFLNEKPKPKDWRKYLVFRNDWKKYSHAFYNRCRTRANLETDAVSKHKFNTLALKLKKIDDEMERHTELFNEIEDNPTDVNAIVAKRRRDFNGEFFRHLKLLQQTYDGLDDRDAVARLSARCLTAVSAYDSTLEIVDTFDDAQLKFDDILNSPSIEVACEKIKSFAKGKQLDSSLILLINSAWAQARESKTMKNEVKEIMYRLYKTTKSSLRSIAPKEIKLLKHLLNFTDPEERFSALATAFCPGGEYEAKDPNALYTTPKELHKWIKIMLDAYTLSHEGTEIREAKQIAEPVVIQRLFILQETIETEYLEHEDKTEEEASKSGDDS